MKVKVSSHINNIGRALRKHSPEILMFAGMATAVTSTVLACKATLRAEDIIFDMHEEVGVNCPDGEVKKVKFRAYCQVAKEYAVPAMTMAAAFGMIFAGNATQRKRYAELAAAYTGLNQAYIAYRKAVREKFGADVDRELLTGATTETMTEIGEDGKKTKKKILVADPNAMYSPYARFFDESSKYWEKDPQMNLDFLMRQQHYWNDYLRRHGHVYFNDVLRSLDIPESSWTNAGWVYDKTNPNIDSEIDFGIFSNIYRPKVRDFVNGYEPVIILDFNVDGDISYLLAKTEAKSFKFEKLPMNYRKTPGGKLIPLEGSDDNA